MRKPMKPLPNAIFQDHPELARPRTLRLGVQFVLRDLWVGVYWTHEVKVGYSQEQPHYPGGLVRICERKVYLCILPCLPLVLTIQRKIEVPYYGK